MLVDYRDSDRLDDSGLENEESESEADHSESSFTVLGSTPALQPTLLGFETLHLGSSTDITAGFNGRCNKPADTCYSFWALGTLAVSLPSCAYVEFSGH